MAKGFYQSLKKHFRKKMPVYSQEDLNTETRMSLRLERLDEFIRDNYKHSRKRTKMLSYVRKMKELSPKALGHKE